jgi:hypothetical protein
MRSVTPSSFFELMHEKSKKQRNEEKKEFVAA